MAAVTDLSGQIAGVHRTWLAPDGANKAPIETPRKAMGELLGHAVRFGLPGDVMAAGEGIENVLSVREVAPGMATAAALSAVHLAAILFPDTLRRLYIVRDHDPAGDAATATLTERANAVGIEAITLSPGSGDFSEDIRRFGIDALRALPHHALGGYLQGGPGMAWSLAQGLQAAVFAFAGLDVNSDLRSAYALAAGPRLSLTAQLPGEGTALLRAGWLGQIAGAARPELQLRFGTQWPLTRDDGIRLVADYARQQASVTAITLAWEHYF